MAPRRNLELTRQLPTSFTASGSIRNFYVTGGNVMTSEPSPAVVPAAEMPTVAKILEFPTTRPRHARTSSGRGAIPNTIGSTVLSMARSASVTSKNFSAAIRPRDFQLLTADGPTPHSSATFAGPPSASRTSSMVRSMDRDYSRNVELSTLHVSTMVTNCGPCLKYAMISEREFILAMGQRLKLLREMQQESQAVFGERIGVGDTAVSNYESGDRVLDPYQALILNQKLKAPLGWLYAGEELELTDTFKAKMAAAQARIDAERARPSRRGRPKGQ